MPRPDATLRIALAVLSLLLVVVPGHARAFKLDGDAKRSRELLSRMIVLQVATAHRPCDEPPTDVDVTRRFDMPTTQFPDLPMKMRPGVFHISYKATLCGEPARGTVAFISPENGPTWSIPLLPGDSLLTYEALKHFYADSIGLAVRAISSQTCRFVRVTDTTVADKVEEPGQYPTAWTETWTVEACGLRTNVEHAFTFDPATNALGVDRTLRPVDGMTETVSPIPGHVSPHAGQREVIASLAGRAVGKDRSDAEVAWQELRRRALEDELGAQLGLIVSMRFRMPPGVNSDAAVLYWAARLASNNDPTGALMLGKLFDPHTGPWKDLRLAGFAYRQSASRKLPKGVAAYDAFSGAYPNLDTLYASVPGFSFWTRPDPGK